MPGALLRVVRSTPQWSNLYCYGTSEAISIVDIDIPRLFARRFTFSRAWNSEESIVISKRSFRTSMELQPSKTCSRQGTESVRLELLAFSNTKSASVLKDAKLINLQSEESSNTLMLALYFCIRDDRHGIIVSDVKADVVVMTACPKDLFSFFCCIWSWSCWTKIDHNKDSLCLRAGRYLLQFDDFKSWEWSHCGGDVVRVVGLLQCI